ncbi:S9 family peptidase [Aporhodopirellula aestuarii]|uniref:DPP IV N-terminal domain-containing protein n=1 Tax=Aporhodopirellula aestuarii TaxID=2950107 RepID=A0ABT0U8S8_9BACT|nr:DPP IV N-terminal domain-containing protein [Aporhodopirellula aestuarii]MCM2373319.1 DPP IV N-terminal domain-containing protein [Aporhodopirellula aestuarii]
MPHNALRYRSPFALISLLLAIGVASTCAAHAPAVDSAPPPAPCAGDRERLCISRIFHGSDFNLETKSLQWDETDDVLWWKRSTSQGHPEIVRLSVPDVDETITVSSDQFQLPSGERISVSDFQWSADHRYLLVFTNTVKVWRANTRGDYWLLDMLSKSWRKLGGESASDQSLMFATFSPKGDAVAYVRDRNLYCEETATGTIHTVAASDNPQLINGTFDWVYEEELSLRRGFQFSPDGSKIAFWQLDETDVPVHSLIDNTSQRYPSLKRFAYPKVGQTNAAARIGVFDFDTQSTTWMKTEGDPRNHYLAALQWLPKDVPGANERLLIQQLTRHQNENRLWIADVSTGNSIVLLNETSPGWVLHQPKLYPLPPRSGSAAAPQQTSNNTATNLSPRSTIDFAWLSERTEWQHLYRLSIDASYLSGPITARGALDKNGCQQGVSLTPITTGLWDVISLDAVDPTSGRCYFTASPSNAATRGLYTCDALASAPIAKPQRVSSDQNGTFAYEISDSTDFALETWSDFSTPPVQRLVRLDKREVIKTLVDNAAVKQALDELKPVDHQFISLTIDDNTSLDAWFMQPVPKADSNNSPVAGKSIPLIVHVYGEPAGQTVRDVFGGQNYLWHRYLTQLGFAVVSIDNRGTASPRGRAFRQSIYGKIGVLTPADQAAGVRRLLERFPQLDPERVGVWGWSGGGSTTLNSMFRHSDLFAAGIAIAPVPDQFDYDTIYQERYMGLVEDDRQRFVDGSPITHAEGLADPLLIVHGTGDDNVHYGSTERLINRLVAAGKQFRLMAYPNRSHSISEGEGTAMHMRQMMTNFFIEHLQPAK